MIPMPAAALDEKLRYAVLDSNTSAHPGEWNHFAEKDSRQINILEQILIAKVFQLWRDLL